MKFCRFFISAVFFLVVLFSCTGKEYLKLPVKEICFKNLTDTLVHGNETDIHVIGTKSILVCDTFLVVLTNDGQGFLKIYSTESMNYLGSFCTKGRARNEFLKPSFYYENAYEEGCDVILPLLDNDINRKDLNISKSIKEGKTIIHSITDIMPYSIGQSFTLKQDTSKQFVYYYCRVNPPKSEAPKYFLKKGKKETEVKVFPRMVQSESDLDGIVGYSCSFHRHPYKDIFVQAFTLRDYLLYFDFETNSHYAVHQEGALSFDDYFDTNAFSSEGGEQVNYLWSGVYTDNFIMFLYGAGDYCIKREDYKPLETPQEVLVFDWPGNYLCGVKLDVRLWSIAYDEKHKVLYGFNNASELIYSFDLTDVL